MEVAFTRINFGIVGRGGARPGTACKASAYNACATMTAADGTRYDFNRKRCEHAGHAVLLPPGTPEAFRDPGELWRAAAAAERRADAQEARQILISLPRELPAALRMGCLKAIAEPWVSMGMGVQVDAHNPAAADHQEQPHGHMLLTMRAIGAEGFGKTKPREWNALFRENDGRAERGRIADRANAFFQAHDLAIRIDPRSLEAQGIDRSPEPAVPRADWQAWLRQGADPARAPITVAAALTHRARRTSLAIADQEAAEAEAEIADLTAQLAILSRTRPPGADRGNLSPPGENPRRRNGRWHPSPNGVALPYLPKSAPPQAAPSLAAAPSVAPARRADRAPAPIQEATMSRPQTRTSARRPAVPEPWMRRAGGLDALDDANRRAAASAYEKWTRSRPGLAQRHDLSDYVRYVQDRQAEARPDQDQEDDASGVSARVEVDGIGPASRPAAEARRRAHLAGLLAGHYAAPAELATLIQRVTLDQGARTVTLHLPGGAQLVDHGDRLTHAGPITPEAAEATAAAAAAHGWDRVMLTGSPAYRNAVGAACALRVPPIGTDHILSRAARDQVATAMRERAAAAVPSLDVAAARQVAATDPAAAAAQVLGHAEARARAALAGCPGGTTDPRELSRPRIADLIERRDQAQQDAQEATAAAAAHRAAHGWTARLLDPATRRRQAGLDDEAHRLDTEARRLDRGHERAVHQVEKDARKQATATAAAQEDWRWSKPVYRAEAQLAQVAAVRAAVQAGDSDTLAAAAQGDLRGTAAAATAVRQARERQAEPEEVDPRAAAVRILTAAERAAGTDPQALAMARRVTAAALAGDPDTVAAAAAGDLAKAQRTAANWRRAQEVQEVAKAATRVAQQQAEPELTATYGGP